jgi:microcystin-dependent protein
MSEPNTGNVGLVVPNTGDLTGAWGTAALNPNFVAIDGLFGGTLTLTPSGATTYLLTTPASATLSPTAGPTQSQNACIFFTGTQTGNAVVQLSMPGKYVMHNKCTINTTYIQVAPSAGTGTAVGLPPWEKTELFYDGTNVDYVNLGRVGSALDLHGATAMPPWMTACTVLPYLIKDGSTYSTANYTGLGQFLGSAFGGNGITTFAVPDERARPRLGLDTVQSLSGATSGRITFAVAGFTGSLMGASGGDQNLSAHTHTPTLTDPGHRHTFPFQQVGQGGGNAASNLLGTGNTAAVGTASTGITLTIATTGSGVGANVQPSIVSFLPLIKT